MRVAIKFCGGCDPSFDRMEFFRKIKAVAGDSIEWLEEGEQDGSQTVLMVCGCEKACPEEGLRHLPRLVSITSNGLSPHCVVAQILEKGQIDEDPDEGRLSEES